MTLRECLAALRAGKLVALPAGAPADSEVVEGVEEQNRSVTTAVRSEPTNIYPGKVGILHLAAVTTRENPMLLADRAKSTRDLPVSPRVVL